MVYPHLYITLLVSILVAAEVALATTASCDTLKITDYGTQASAGCRLWVDVVTGIFPRPGGLVYTTTESGNLLLSDGQYWNVVYELGLDNIISIWSGTREVPGDLSDTTLAAALYSSVLFIVTSDHKQFFLMDNGKLKKADVLANRVTHIAGNGAKPANSEALFASLGSALDVPLFGANQGFAAKGGSIYLLFPVGQFPASVVLRYDPGASVVTLAVPMAAISSNSPSIVRIFPPPPASADGDLVILSCQNLTCANQKLHMLKYTNAEQTVVLPSTDGFGNSFPLQPPVGTSQPLDKATLFYLDNATRRILKYDVLEAQGMLDTGIGGSLEAVEPGAPQWADNVKFDTLGGMTFTPDDRHLWILSHIAKRQYLILVSWKSATLPLPDARAPPYMGKRVVPGESANSASAWGGWSILSLAAALCLAVSL